MHYATAERREHLNHGLSHDPFKAIVAPRPIGWIATVSAGGVLNLAPYSFFNAVSEAPPMVMFASAGRKDSLTNIEATGEFTCSVASQALVDHMNLSSAAVASDIDEFAMAGLPTARSLVVAPPRVAACPAALECRLWKTVELPGERPATVVFGQVVAIYVDERMVKNGVLDTAAMRPLARMGYMDYAVVTAETTFTLNRPVVDDDRRSARVTPGPWDGVYR
ncbi:MAG TPA: flavin reductase family protein [Vicinamibacterales bacterium]|nr:flavin reductase family protein [Vicinamibacterales bacterium]